MRAGDRRSGRSRCSGPRRPGPPPPARQSSAAAGTAAAPAARAATAVRPRADRARPAGAGAPLCVRGARLVDAGRFCALEVRHLQRTEVGEVQEPFAAGAQKGSSASASQAQSVALGAALRAGTRAPGQPAGRARGCRAVARARHVALVGGAHRPHRFVDPRVLHDRAIHRHRRRAHREHRQGSARASTRRTAWCSARRCSSRLVEAGLERDDAYRLVQQAASAYVGGARRATVPRSARRRSPEMRRGPGGGTPSTSASISTVRSRMRTRAVDSARSDHTGERLRASPSLHRQGPGALRGRPRSHARRGVRPDLGVQRRAQRPGSPRRTGRRRRRP